MARPITSKSKAITARRTRDQGKPGFRGDWEKRANRRPILQPPPARRRRRHGPDPPLSLDPLALIRKRQLADLLGIATWTVDLWRRQGKLPPPIVLSAQTLAWRRSVIEKWLAEREANPAQPRNAYDETQKRTASERTGR